LEDTLCGNDVFRELARRDVFLLPPTNKHPDDYRSFVNTNLLLRINDSDGYPNRYFFRYATGMKTGFTTPAGSCLIASANRNGFELITVVLGANRENGGVRERYQDTIALFNYGYSNYAIRAIVREGELDPIRVNGIVSRRYLNVDVEERVFVLVRRYIRSDRFVPRIETNENIKTPIRKGDVVRNSNISYRWK